MSLRWYGVLLVGLIAIAGAASPVGAQDDADGIMECIDAFMNAFNARGNEGMQAAVEYPHVFSLPDGTVESYAAPEDFVTDFEELVKQSDWAVSEVDSISIVQKTPVKAHVAVNFSSYNSEGERYSSSSALWVMLKQKDEWKISMRSWLGPQAVVE